MVKHRFQAQALVEFALVIVLLLTIIFGVLEVGRLLFVYAAVITSSREAVRYGSVAGINEDGNLYYQDCTGIRNAARKLAFFQDLQDEDILIDYEIAALGTTFGENSCDEYDLSDGTVDGVAKNLQPALGDRIRVRIRASFTPIVPIVPLEDMERWFSSSRTILGIIKLE